MCSSDVRTMATSGIYNHMKSSYFLHTSATYVLRGIHITDMPSPTLTESQ